MAKRLTDKTVALPAGRRWPEGPDEGGPLIRFGQNGGRIDS